MRDEPQALAKLANWGMERSRYKEKLSIKSFEESVAELCIKNLSADYITNMTHYVYELGYVLSTRTFLPRKVIEKAMHVVPLMSADQLSVLAPCRKNVVPAIRFKFELAMLHRFLELLQDHGQMNTRSRLNMFSIFMAVGKLFDQDQLNQVKLKLIM